MIIPEQIRAARALLDLSQSVLGERVGLSQTSLAQIENGRTQPTRKTLDVIAATLEAMGVEFIEGGVRLRPSGLDIIRGPDFGLRMMEYTFSTLYQTGAKELMINALDMAVFEEDHRRAIEEHVARLQAHGMFERVLVKEGQRHEDLIGPKSWYRVLSADAFSAASPCFIFSDRYGIMLWEAQEILIIKNRHLAEDQRRKFDFMWERSSIIA